MFTQALMPSPARSFRNAPHVSVQPCGALEDEPGQDSAPPARRM